MSSTAFDPSRVARSGAAPESDEANQARCAAATPEAVQCKEALADVHCAAQTHSRSGSAFSCWTQELQMMEQNCCSFFDDVAVYGRYTGGVMEPVQASESASH